MKKNAAFVAILSTLALLASACGESGGADANRNRGGTSCSPSSLADAPPTEARAVTLSPNGAEARYWERLPGTPRSEAGLVFVSGVDGGFVEPADNMYTRLARAYAARGVPSIFVRYRTPGVLEESVPDALAAIEFLKEQGVRRIALSGWSFGGAVIVNTAVRAPEVVTVVGYAPQALDTEPVAGFTGQSLLLIHSDNDENVPFESSQEILDEAPAHLHKEFVPITSGADHLLDGEGDNLSPRVKAWIDAELNPPPYCDE